MSFCNKKEIVGTKDLQITRLQKIYIKVWAYWNHSFDMLSWVPSGLIGPPLGVAVLTPDQDIFFFFFFNLPTNYSPEVSISEILPQRGKGKYVIKTKGVVHAAVHTFCRSLLLVSWRLVLVTDISRHWWILVFF